MAKIMTATIYLHWSDDSETHFEVEVEGEEHECMSTIMWVTRGSLMASGAVRAIACDGNGHGICSYYRN